MSPKSSPASRKTAGANSAPTEGAERRKRRSAANTQSRSVRGNVPPSSGAPPSKRVRAGVRSESAKVPTSGQKRTVTQADDRVAVAADNDTSIVIPFTAWRPGTAIRAAVRQQTVTVNLPLVGPVTLPSAPHMAWYAGVATLAVLEVVEWPVAIVMVTAKALADSTHHQLVSQFGQALEKGA